MSRTYPQYNNKKRKKLNNPIKKKKTVGLFDDMSQRRCSIAQ
jgi:hypothetical protein